ncbi:NPP1 family protein [Nonomuraea sp. PA05]|uniref:NPP1 family protein n=1 Tax=Nonomuraea sp. PA05 TaxID=2604466 RepID=UPI0016520CEF|nr:NPP1 family protein [Nonomuraea sp. PA05]
MLRRIATLVLTSLACLAFLAPVSAPASAGTASDTASDTASGGWSMRDFANWSAPLWLFARAHNNDPCWPQPAFGSDGAPAAGAKVTAWPDSDSGCPRVGTPFPTYYTAKHCNPNEIRVVYSLYLARSYFAGGGHPHDFEYVEVVWNKDANGTWDRSWFLMSTHGKHRGLSWDRAESISGDDRTTVGRGLAHPRAYVGWGSHAMFNGKGGLRDIVSQLYGQEYRSDTYSSWATESGGLVEVADGSALAARFDAAAAHFGKADSNPARLGRELCSHKIDMNA